MKIYNKKGFWEGIVSLIVCLVGFTTIAIRGFGLKLMILSVLLLLFGTTGIARSMSSDKSREDLFINNDERDKYIQLLTAQKSLKILHMLNFIFLIVFMIAYGITKQESLLITLIMLALFLTLSFLVVLVCNIYYEKHQ